VLNSEEDEAFISDVEKYSVIDLLALVPYFEPPDFPVAGYVFDLWVVPGLG